MSRTEKATTPAAFRVLVRWGRWLPGAPGSNGLAATASGFRGRPADPAAAARSRG